MDDVGDYLRRVGGVDTFQWNPLRPLGGEDDEPRLLNNFGDLLGPLVIELVLESLAPGHRLVETPGRRVVSVGSVMHFSRPGDVVWGTGINGKVSNASVHGERRLDVRAVRGPWSAAYMTSRGIAVPRVYGDPALLLPRLMPELVQWAATKRTDVLVAPNFNDLAATLQGDRPVLVPIDPLRTVLRTIAQSRFVVGSSLHAVVIADALGIPARFVASSNEATFKYRDYLGGTGRPMARIATSVDEAIAIGPHEPPDVDLDLLLASFPADVWELDVRPDPRASQTATFPGRVVTDVRRRFAGEATAAELAAQLFAQQVPALVETAGAGAPDALRAAVEETALYCELVVPEALDLAPDEHFRELVELVLARDTDRLAAANQAHDREARAVLRARRAAADGVVLALSLQTDQARGAAVTVAVELVAPNGEVVTAPVPPSPFHAHQWHLDVDAYVPFAALGGGTRWSVNVLLTGTDGTVRRLPLGAPGGPGLPMTPTPRAEGAAEGAADPAPADPWVLDLAAAPSP